MLGWTRRGVGASERAVVVVVECSAGKTYMSYTKDERAGVGGGNGRRAGQRARLRLMRERWGAAERSVRVVVAVVVAVVVKRGIYYCCRRSGGRRI